MSNLVGQQVSHYQIKALLGSGRIGTVYQAIDLKDFSVVALKIIKLEFARQHDVRRRFLEEIKSRPHLDHPGIIQVYEAGVDTQLDLLYMTMAFMTGRSLTAYLQQLEFNKQRINMHAALILVAEVAEALHYAHEKGLVHQDVRPNVILFKDGKSDKGSLLPGHAAIGDFTLTTILEQEAELFTDSLPYLAPELFLAQGSDGRSDIYSLGIILYQLMTGRTPFSAGTVAEATRQHPYQDPPLPSSIRTDLPIAIEDAILKAIAKKPENRYQTGAEMAHALRQLADTISTKTSISDEQSDINIVKTQPEPLDSPAIHSAWSTNEDRVTITRNLPHSLNRQVITVGRSESNDIVLPETSITRRHAQLERTQTGWQVRDLGSQNGTYLDGKALLPDIPEDWDSHQTLRIGPYFLHLQAGKGYDYQKIPFSLSVTPDMVEVHAGQQTELHLTIRNDGDSVGEFVFKMDRFPADWVTLPTGPLRLRPNDPPTVVKVLVHPPKAEDILLGRHRYLLTMSSQANEQEKIAVPGVVVVLPAEEHFSTQLLPTEIVGKGRMQLMVANAGLMEKTFHITAPNPDKKLRLGMWQLKKLPETPQAIGGESQKGGRKRPSSSLSSASSRLPFIRRLLSAPRQALTRLQSGPRRALNRILPGLGSLMPRLKLPTSISLQSGKKGQVPAKETSPNFRNNYKELIFPDALYTEVDIPAGQEETVYLSVASRKRPLWGRENHLLPLEIAVSNGNGRQQTVTGQLETKPRLRTTAWTPWLILLALFACSLATYTFILKDNTTIPAMLSSSRDRDNDGLGNLSEVYVYQTDPNNPDSDNDTLSDAVEIADGINPNRADTDGDGLDDAREQRINTNPRLADTDNDSFSDGWEVLQLGTDPLTADPLSTIVLLRSTPSPTATRTPTHTPVPTATASPPATNSELSLRSRSQEDGYILQMGSSGQFVLENDETLQVGEGRENDQQSKSVLSFNTAHIPDGAIIETATLRLYQINSAGNITSLGDLHVDIAQVSGFNDNTAIEGEDFSASAAMINAVTLIPASSNEQWVTGVLSETGKQALNRQGVTQFRLYFTLPNNNDDFEDWVRFYAGDAERNFRPELIISYTLPG